MSEHRIAGYSVEQLVSAALDRALVPSDADALEAHLRECRECRALHTRRVRLDGRTRALMSRPASASERAEIWSRVTERRRARPPRVLGLVAQIAFAAVLLVVAVVAGALLAQRNTVTTPAPVREAVAGQSFALPDGGAGTLTIEQGSALARTGWQTGVGARAELRLTRPATRGSAEIRFRLEGDPAYGILGLAPDLTGVTRVNFGGAFPRPAGSSSLTYEVWVHVETDVGSVDGTSTVIELITTRRGEEARAR